MFDELEFRDSAVGEDIQIADYVSGPVEVKALHLAKGATIPLHSHSNAVTHLIVSGELEFGDGVRYPAGGNYECGGWEYRGLAIEESYVLLIQFMGTEFKLVEQV